MRYERGGRHLVHHDAGYDYGDGRRTLASVVLYLTGGPEPEPEPGPGSGSSGSGSGPETRSRDRRGRGLGATRLVDDGQSHLPVWARDHRDWDRDTRPDEVLAAVPPERGAALVLDHRIAHDVARWDGPGPRIVIRADVVYEAVPDGRSLP